MKVQNADVPQTRGWAIVGVTSNDVHGRYATKAAASRACNRHNKAYATGQFNNYLGITVERYEVEWRPSDQG